MEWWGGVVEWGAEEEDSGGVGGGLEALVNEGAGQTHQRTG